MQVEYKEIASFFVPNKPVTQGSLTAFISDSTGKPVTPQLRKVKLHRADIAKYAARAAAKIKYLDLCGPVAVGFVFYVKRPKYHYKKNGEFSSRAIPFPIKRSSGDNDKLQRCVFDALAGVLYKDDSQVVDVRYSYKRFADDAPVGTSITIYSMGEI